MLLPLITSQYLENTMCIRDIGISCWEHLTSLTLFLHFSILHLPISITSLKSFLSDSYSRNSTEMNRKPLKCQTKFAHLLSTHFPFPLSSSFSHCLYDLFSFLSIHQPSPPPSSLLLHDALTLFVPTSTLCLNTRSHFAIAGCSRKFNQRVILTEYKKSECHLILPLQLASG